MSDQDYWEEAYEENSATVLVFESDGDEMFLKVKQKPIPGLEQSGSIWVTRKSGKYSFNFGFCDEDIDEDNMPNPVKKLIDSKGGGPGGNKAAMPQKQLCVNYDGLPRPYDEYRRLFNTNKWKGLRVYDKPLPERLYYEFAKFYLDQMGTPLYL